MCLLKPNSLCCIKQIGDPTEHEIIKASYSWEANHTDRCSWKNSQEDITICLSKTRKYPVPY